MFNPTLVQSQVASLLVQPLEQASSFLAAGPVIIDSSSPVRIPRVANGASAGFVAEGAQIPDGDVGFDEIQLLPSTLKGIKVLVKFTNELLRQNVVALDAVLKQRLVADVANALDAALYTGADGRAKGPSQLPRTAQCRACRSGSHVGGDADRCRRHGVPHRGRVRP